MAAARTVHALVDRLRPQLEELGDVEQVRALAEAALARRNSADRQRAAFAERGHLDDVVRQVVAETRGDSSGISTDGPVLPGYRVRGGDEAVALGSGPRPAYDVRHAGRAAEPATGPEALPAVPGLLVSGKNGRTDREESAWSWACTSWLPSSAG